MTRIRIRKFKTRKGFVYEAEVLRKGIKVTASKRKKALKKLKRKMRRIEFKNKVIKKIKKFLRIK